MTTFNFAARSFLHLAPLAGTYLLPSPLRGGVGGGDNDACQYSWLPPSPALPRKGEGSYLRRH
jgi:hypothetical protein